MDNFLLDTNAVLDFLKGEEKIITVFKTEMKDKPRFVSQVGWVERSENKFWTPSNVTY